MGDTNGTQDVFVHDRQTGTTSRVSVDSAGVQGNGLSYYSSISADGRYVAFVSEATNLVAEDNGRYSDIFVHDRQTGKTSLVSVNSAGVQSDSFSYAPSISADWRYVAFESLASNLVAEDDWGDSDIFVHDRQTGQTERASVNTAGGNVYYDSYLCDISADGRYVAFWSEADNIVVGDTNGERDVFIRDRLTGQTERASVDSAGSQGKGFSWGCSLSADGRFVSFESWAYNLIVGDTNGSSDIFVRDRLAQPRKQTDVSLALRGPASAVKGSDVRYTFTVSNNGNINAADTTLIGVVSSQGILKSIISSQGRCRLSPVPVCRLGSLAPGQRVTMTATMTINGATTINATAQAAPKDSKPGNNTKSIATLLQ